MNVDQLQKNVQHESKQAPFQTPKALNKQAYEGKLVKKEQKPIKLDWLAKHTPPKPEAMKCYHEWNGTK